eukprot:gene11681-11770_t
MEDRKIVLMDEPFAALDAKTRCELQEYAVTALKGKTVLLVTHDISEVIRLSNQIYILKGFPAEATLVTEPHIQTILEQIPAPRAIHDLHLWQEASAFLNMATIMGANKKATLRFIRLPAALPCLMSGVRLAAIHAPLTVLAADWIGASSGLGYLIMLSHGRLQIELMFACIVCITLMTFALNKGVTLLEKKLVFWPSNTL